MNLNKQNFSFLGGLVSRKLDERRDMDKFDKWFKVADNMRFFSTGAMQNRTGFVKVANTMNDIPNDNIRLLPFVFNNKESFLLEIGQGYMRVFKDGVPICDNDGSIKVWDTGISFPADTDLKYAQSGDIIFLTIPSKGIFEIRRQNIAGTEWGITSFNAKIYPAGDENTNKKNNIKITSATGGTSYYQGNFENVVKSYGFDLFFDISKCEGKNVIGSAYTCSTPEHKGMVGASEVVAYLNEKYISYSRQYVLSGDDIVIKIPTSESAYDNDILHGLRVSTFGPFEKQIPTPIRLSYSTASSDYRFTDGTIPLKIVMPDSLISLCPYLETSYSLTPDDLRNIAPSYPNALIAAFNAKIQKSAQSAQQNTWPTLSVITSDSNPRVDIVYNRVHYDPASAFGRNIVEAYSGPSKLQLVSGPTAQVYDAVTADFDFFENLSVGESFYVRHHVNAKSSSGTQTSGVASSVFLNGSSNRWRFTTSGNWIGNVSLSYFSQKDGSWQIFREISSPSEEQPLNDNSSGEITEDELVDYKISFSLSKGSVCYDFNTSSSEVSSVFVITEKTDARHAQVQALKNPPSSEVYVSTWSLPAFSNKSGWPSSIGFYQNRLFFGKDYNLYGSKTNDFWDFYEPVAVNDDDPINMSLLSYKVNEIVNVVTLKSFFVFTGGGEFGIGSSGALTQKDKFLRQYSAHGSAQCLPIVAGNIIMFVDISEHTVRAFQYSFETDTYEAQDISVMLDEIIKDEKIISTAYSSNEKEGYFLTEKGEIFVLKFFPEQNIMAWSKWKHAKYQIKNICVMPRGNEEDLYVAVNTENGMQIERMVKDIYADSVNILNFDNEVEEASVPFQTSYNVVVNDGVNKYNAVVDENGKIKLARPAKSIEVGLAYKSKAVMLAPVIMTQDGNATTYNVRKTFKAYFKYSDSYGFKVGVYGHEHMEPNYQEVNQTIDNETVLTTGKKSVLMPSRYDMQSGISFLQEKPYPMIIENVMLDVDYGNK